MNNRAMLSFLVLSLLSLGLSGCAENHSSTSTIRTTTFNDAQGECTDGGVKIELLVDGTVDDTQTQLICNSADGQNLVISGDDKNLLVTTTDNVGNNCTDGGIRIDAGLDKNDNGTLDSDEILKTRYACNSADGQNLVIGEDDKDLLVTTTHNVGEHCAISGIRIDAGLDTNDNGTLESDEILNSRYVCTGEHYFYIGNTITFGHYEQDNDTSNGKEPIKWRVIDTKPDGQILVISEKALDNKPFGRLCLWENSEIRSWLNGYPASYNNAEIDYTSDNFIDTAFTAEEKARIVESDVPAHANPYDDSVNQGNDTTDKVFLLSLVELEEYLPGEKNFMADATQYVIKEGANVFGSESDHATSDGTCADTHCYAKWWLRTKGSAGIAAVNNAGWVITTGLNTSGNGSAAVRPAMWITY